MAIISKSLVEGSKQILGRLAILLVTLLCLEQPVFGEEAAHYKLGPLQIGMTLEQTQRVLGTPGFHWFRTGGISFLSRSGDAELFLDYHPTTRTLILISLSSDRYFLNIHQQMISRMSEDGASEKDWQSVSNFRLWESTSGIGLAETREEVLRLLGVDDPTKIDFFEEIWVEYKSKESPWKNRRNPLPPGGSVRKIQDGRVLEIVREIPGAGHFLRIKFAHDRVDELSLSWEPYR